MEQRRHFFSQYYPILSRLTLPLSHSLILSLLPSLSGSFSLGVFVSVSCLLCLRLSLAFSLNFTHSYTYTHSLSLRSLCLSFSSSVYLLLGAIYLETSARDDLNVQDIFAQISSRLPAPPQVRTTSWS